MAKRTRGWRWAAMSAPLVVIAACSGGPDAPAQPSPSPPKRTDAVRAQPESRTDTIRADSAATDSTAAVVDARPRVENRKPARDIALLPLDTFRTGPRPAVPGAADLPVPILPGALLPETRIVAFYGNPVSERMGILGEVPPDEMLRRLDAEVAAWRDADPQTPVRPALQVITVMATGDPGRDSLYRLRAPDQRIREVQRWAARRNALLILDVQVGHSTVEAELGPLTPWLVRPDVHLALDPEWAMPPGTVPGQVIGSLDAAEINYAIDFLAGLVDQYHLPPKILVVHRFTQAMITNAHKIRRDPRVQVIINMDGWGAPANKRAAYHDIVAPEADQFTGFKLFFHNDRRNDSVLLTPPEILELDPPPLYIQYQ